MVVIVKVVCIPGNGFKRTR